VHYCTVVVDNPLEGQHRYDAELELFTSLCIFLSTFTFQVDICDLCWSCKAYCQPQIVLPNLESVSLREHLVHGR